ncbi:insulinase family protein [Brevibacterium sp. R8603A2]|uniref:M16 family metallopeptidase n=1 Tax=unclassified Brevibacterium TaxID=2614124 RepID=UPI001FFA4B72|nr:pitrilysin family protein [Brevibacterium sp. R8603A2]MCK1801973.1 insulinase family protein [Brevibacterium sp. R8603A2]
MITEQLLGEGSSVYRSVLPSGIRVISETMPGLESETVGIWVDSGSRDEAPTAAGSTHFLEHMLFKGTPQRSARRIAEEFDRTGGESNAVTAKEYTCYFSRCLVDDVDHITALLWDMVLHSTLDAREFERERGVILEELAMSADDPGEVLYDAFDEFVYAGHPLGRPVGARKEQIRALDHRTLLDHYAHDYVGPRLVFAAAGGAEHSAVVEMVARATADLPELSSAPGAGLRPVRTPPEFHGGVHTVVKDTEQQGIILGMPGLPEADDERFTMTVLYSLLGGGMSSRLFQEIREERGLAYSVHCIASTHADSGQFGIYAGTSPASAQQVIDLCAAELDRLATTVPGRDEVEAIVSQVAGSTVLGLESSAARMNRLARAELYGRPLQTPSELIDRVRAVTPEQVTALAERLAAGPRALVTCGPGTAFELPG